jgi:hypothetical protein
LIQLYRWFPSILKVITIIRPETLVHWHRAGFRCYWRWKTRPRGAPTDLAITERQRRPHLLHTISGPPGSKVLTIVQKIITSRKLIFWPKIKAESKEFSCEIDLLCQIWEHIVST